MTEYRSIKYQNLPCRYELAWSGNPLGVIFRVHPDIVANLVINPKAPIVVDLMTKFKFTNFGSDLKDDCGFEKVFKFINFATDGFAEYLVEIPALRHTTDKRCRHCRGTGRDKWNKEDGCFSCRGSGKEEFLDWQKAYAISATFNVLTSAINFFKFESLANKNQLLIFNVYTAKGQHGGSISGEFGILVEKWLSGFAPRMPIVAINEVLIKTWQHIFGRADFLEKHKLKASIGGTKGFFIIDVPGDATGIVGTDHYIRENEGCEFCSHNVDTPAQQLTLITGLAKLHDLVRNQGI